MVSGPVLLSSRTSRSWWCLCRQAAPPTRWRDLAESAARLPGRHGDRGERGGRGRTAGATKVAKASADGYTLLVHHIGMAAAPLLYRGFKPPRRLSNTGTMVNEVP